MVARSAPAFSIWVAMGTWSGKEDTHAETIFQKSRSHGAVERKCVWPSARHIRGSCLRPWVFALDNPDAVAAIGQPREMHSGQCWGGGNAFGPSEPFPCGLQTLFSPTENAQGAAEADILECFPGMTRDGKGVRWTIFKIVPKSAQDNVPRFLLACVRRWEKRKEAPFADTLVQPSNSVCVRLREDHR
jgi:hypothetical protein